MPTLVNARPCPVCKAGPKKTCTTSTNRLFHDCGTCGLIFADSHLDQASEVDRYAHHNNTPDNEGYRQFLLELIVPLTAKAHKSAQGLDFGCGPSPVAAELFLELGYSIESYDPNFFPDPALASKKFDFILCNEVAEHFREPLESFGLIDSVLAPNGILGLRTSVYRGETSFATWWYVRDPTHVSIYREKTLEWIAREFGWRMESPGRDLWMIRKGC